MTMIKSISKNIAPEYVLVNGSKQWIYYMGNNTADQIMLFLHGGPGTPETAFLDKFNTNLCDRYIIACWEQRGAGKSFRINIPASTMNMGQFIEDAHVITQHLKGKFNREKIIIMGHSWGTILGMRCVKRYPEDYLAYVAVSQCSNTLQEEKIIYDWLKHKIQFDNNKRAKHQFTKITRVDHEYTPSLKEILKKQKWVYYYGGAWFFNDRKSYGKLARIILKAKMYSIFDKLKYLWAEKFTLKHLFAEIISLDLFEEIGTIDIPVVFFHGSGDYQVPVKVAKSYSEHLNAPYKKFIEFRECAHGIFSEKPEEFRKSLLDALDPHSAPKIQ